MWQVQRWTLQSGQREAQKVQGQMYCPVLRGVNAILAVLGMTDLWAGADDISLFCSSFQCIKVAGHLLHHGACRADK